jgi:hypothetical protein
MLMMAHLLAHSVKLEIAILKQAMHLHRMALALVEHVVRTVFPVRLTALPSVTPVYLATNSPLTNFARSVHHSAVNVPLLVQESVTLANVIADTHWMTTKSVRLVLPTVRDAQVRAPVYVTSTNVMLNTPTPHPQKSASNAPISVWPAQ